MFWRKINVIVQVPFVMPIASHGLCVLQHFCVMTQQMETDIHLHHDYRCSLFIKEKKCKGTFWIFKLGLFCFISLFAITVTIYRLSYDNILQAICGSNLAQNINCHLSEKISLFVWDETISSSFHFLWLDHRWGLFWISKTCSRTQCF